MTWGYEFYFLVAKTIFYSLAALVRKILFCHSKIKFIFSRHRVISSIYVTVRLLSGARLISQTWSVWLSFRNGLWGELFPKVHLMHILILPLNSNIFIKTAFFLKVSVTYSYLIMPYTLITLETSQLFVFALLQDKAMEILSSISRPQNATSCTEFISKWKTSFLV